MWNDVRGYLQNQADTRTTLRAGRVQLRVYCGEGDAIWRRQLIVGRTGERQRRISDFDTCMSYCMKRTINTSTRIWQKTERAGFVISKLKQEQSIT